VANREDEGFEYIGTFKFVFEERIFLGITPQIHRLPQGFHGFEVIEPFFIEFFLI
jgi:hypothetical protein